MSAFNFYAPIEVRFGDLDPLWHVNNANFLTYIEQARLLYFLNLGLWDGVSFHDLGTILADSHVSYLVPIKLGQKLRVGVRVARIGNKSMSMEYQIEDAETLQFLAKAESVNVSFDYHTQTTVRVLDSWREKITAFENNPGNNQ